MHSISVFRSIVLCLAPTALSHPREERAFLVAEALSLSTDEIELGHSHYEKQAGAIILSLRRCPDEIVQMGQLGSQQQRRQERRRKNSSVIHRLASSRQCRCEGCRRHEG